MEPVRARARASARRLGSFFAFYSRAADLSYEEPIIDQGTIELPRTGALGGVRWRLVLVAGTVVGILPYLLVVPVVYGYLLFLLIRKPVGLSIEEFAATSSIPAGQFGDLVGAWGLPALQMLLAGLVTSWVVRRVGNAAVAHGLLIALVSVAVLQVVTLYSGYSVNPIEVAKYLAMVSLGALLGGVEARKALAGQEALYEVSRGISAAREPRAVVAAVSDYLEGLKIGGVALWQAPLRVGEDPSGDSGRSKEGRWWFSQDYWPAGLGFDSVDAPALAEGGGPQTLRLGDLPTRERTAWGSWGAHSVLVLPLISPGGERVGLLAVASRGRRRIPRSAVHACLTVSAQAALVLENLRLVEEARRAGRQAGVLKERQRMAHEIHDTLAQGFTSIVMNLEAADGMLPVGSTRLRHHVDQARLTARESLTEARRLVWALRPEPLEKASLPEAMGRLVERWSNESGVAAGVTVTGTPCPLSPDIEATLYRTAQEALNNVRKHANASRVALTLSYMGDLIALDARDDGVGFDPLRTDGEKRDRTSGGFGLKGMRERVEQCGGTLSVESATGEGTTLAVELPAAEPEGGGLVNESLADGSEANGSRSPLRDEPVREVR